MSNIRILSANHRCGVLNLSYYLEQSVQSGRPLIERYVLRVDEWVSCIGLYPIHLIYIIQIIQLFDGFNGSDRSDASAALTEFGGKCALRTLHYSQGLPW